MGFGTNTLGLPGLLGAGCLALSDANNHASLILGLRLARATVRVFRHNDVRHLEQLARAAVAEGKWRKIVIVSTHPSPTTLTYRDAGKFIRYVSRSGWSGNQCQTTTH